MRWKESSCVNKATPTSRTAPASKTMPDRLGKPEVGGVGMSLRKSPFFEEFSDVEEVESEDQRRDQSTGSFLLSTDAMATDNVTHKPEGDCPDMEEEELASPCTPPLSALIGDRSFASLGNLVSLMQSREEGHAHTNLGADTSAGVEEDRSSGAGNEEQGLSGISDISLDSPDEESEDGAPLPVEVGVVSTEKAISVASSDNTVGVASPETHLGVVISEKPVGVPSAEKAVCVVSSEKAVAGGSVDVSDVSSDSLDGPPVGPTGVTLTEPMGVVESGGVAESMGGEISEGALVAAEEPAKPMETESGSGLASSGSGQFGSGSGISDDAVIAPPTSPSALPTPLKTPGKRKINLSEYRNRAARRPVERKGSGEKVSTPPNTPGTPAFLTAHSSLFPPTTTSAYTPLLQFPSGATSSNSDTVPQFEPVSPDEDDHASKLPSRDDVSSTTLLSTLGGVPPSLGVASSGGVAPMTYSCTPGSNLYNPYASTLQNKGALPVGVASGGSVLPGALSGGVATPGTTGPPVHVGSVAGSYGPEGGGARWEVPGARPPGVGLSSSSVVIPGGAPPPHHAPGGLLQAPHGPVPVISYSTAAPPPSNSGGHYMSQPPPRGPAAPGAMYPVNPPGYFRSQQQLNPTNPSNQGAGPGMYRPRRPHPPNAGSNNHYY